MTLHTSPIAVTVIGGDLGAGKTSLLNHLLRTAPEPVAVLVNDFGELAIDQDLIETTDGALTTLANGCICCSLADGFAAAMDEVRALADRPGRLVIETSGVADPAQVAAHAHTPGFALDAVVVVADAEAVRRRASDRYVGDMVVRQLRAADLLVVNKTDLVSSADLDAVDGWLAHTAGGPPAVHAVGGAVDPAVLTGAGVQVRHTPSPAGPPATDAYQSWTFRSDGPLDRSRLEEALTGLPGGIYRAKGIVRAADDPDTALVVQVVGRRRTVTPAGEWTGGPSRLVAIGRPGALSADWWTRLGTVPG